MTTYYIHIMHNNMPVMLDKIDETIQAKYIIGLYETETGPTTRIVRDEHHKIYSHKRG